MSNVETTTHGNGTTNGSGMERQPRSRVPEGETREDKFVRLGLARMTALKQKAELVKNLAAYPHTEYQANKIVAVVHSPLTTENEGSDEWDGCLGKRAPISHYRFALPADRDVPSRSESDALGTGI